MAIHLSIKRFTKDKTENMVNKLMSTTALAYKERETKLEKMLNEVREIKVLLKKLDKIWQYNEKKIKNKPLTESDCNKEKILANKIDELIASYVKDYNNLENTKGKEKSENVEILRLSNFFDTHTPNWYSEKKTEDIL